MNQQDVEKRVIARLVQAGQSMSTTALQRELKDVDPRFLSDAIRSLMETRKISLHQAENSTERFLSLINNLAENLAVVLDVIRASGTEGVDQSTICNSAKLAKSEVTKALNQLVGQQRIKDTRCFTNKAKKLYMLFEFEPSVNVTGGTFYTENRDIDTLFIDALRARTVSFIGTKVAASATQIKAHLDSAKGDAAIGKKATSLRDVEIVLISLELDGIVEKVFASNKEVTQYQLCTGRSVARHLALPSGGSRSSGGGGSGNNLGVIGNGVTGVPVAAALVGSFPCTGCPMLERCCARGLGAVNPIACTYLTDWLKIQN